MILPLSDRTLMEDSLAAAADSGAELRHGLFERFFTAYPERRRTFLNVEAASIRMTDETLEMMLGIAGQEQWVWPLVTELVFTHRSYGRLPMEEYDAFIDLSIDELASHAADQWNQETDAAWRRQAARLKTMIVQARTEWEELMPPGYVEEMS